MIRSLIDRAIFYENHHGSSTGCNVAALFHSITLSREFFGWLHVLVVKKSHPFRSKIDSSLRVIEVEFEGPEYWRLLSRCKYIICNSALPERFIRHRDQRYLNTWHGTPIKCLGADVPGAFLEHQNGSRNFLQATHLISPNAHTTQALSSAYGTGGIFGGEIAETGYPRVDITLNATASQKRELMRLLGLNEGERVVLYAPTWRGTLGKVQRPDVARLRADLDALSHCGAKLLFRAHHLVEATLPSDLGRVHVVPQHIDTNALLCVVDVLITDYSSVTFDFLATGRPIVHYLYDLDAYGAAQGLYLQPKDLPGEVLCDVASVAQQVSTWLSADRFVPETHYREAQKKFCPHDDGHATQRVVDFFFHGDQSHRVSLASERKRVLFFAGQFVTNGVTTSFLNLANSLDCERVQPVLLVDREGVVSDRANVHNLQKLDGAITVLGRCGPMQLSADEEDLLAWFNERHFVCEGAMAEALERIYQREWRRLFGDAVFDVIINFEGYSPHWAALFAFAPRENAKCKAIYLHNDMERERLERFPYLSAVRYLYASYDKLVSVGQWVGAANRSQIAQGLPALATEKFVEVSNPIRVDRIHELAGIALPPPLAALMASGRSFLALGRLSPEKDHTKLLNAFATVLTHSPDALLIIAGEGPLSFSLKAHASQLGINHRVAFLGNVANPYPLLRAAKCLVLSSNYEGQPMVLREALVLGTAVIATDIGACREMLDGGYGLLVENSETGLAAGMLKYLAGDVSLKTMDARQYERHALHSFYENLVN